MAKQRSVEVRVGIFVLACLFAGGWMILRFGKFTPRSQEQYPVIVMFDNVGGLIPDSPVMYAGVGIGKVRDIRLVEQDRIRARVTLAIYKDVKIRKDAKFVINQSGLLGDRYVDVIPLSATAPALEPNEIVSGSPSVDLTEAIRGVVDVLHQTAGAIARVDGLIARVDGTVKRIDEEILSTQNLNHVSNTLGNVDSVSSNAVALTEALRSVIDDNRKLLDAAMQKFSGAADNINIATKRVDDFVVATEPEVQAAAKKLAESSQHLSNILERLEKGEGTAGKLLIDPSLHDELVRLVQNWRRYGILYKEPKVKEVPKAGQTPVPSRPAEKPPGK